MKSSPLLTAIESDVPAQEEAAQILSERGMPSLPGDTRYLSLAKLALEPFSQVTELVKQDVADLFPRGITEKTPPVIAAFLMLADELFEGPVDAAMVITNFAQHFTLSEFDICCSLEAARGQGMINSIGIGTNILRECQLEVTTKGRALVDRAYRTAEHSAESDII